jgi:uncharacterized membrane protein YoaK (UPF0700 family)
MTTPHRTAQGRRAFAALLVLSFAAGAADAFAFLLLGGIFTANMTGNLILAGLPTRPGYLSVLLGAALAVTTFSVALYGGFRLQRNHSRVLTLLLAAGGIQIVVAGLWLASGMRGVQAFQLLVIALAAGALGLQTVAGRTVSGNSSITTTFATGTITASMKALALREPDRQLPVRLGSVAALSGGALVSSALIALAPPLGPAIAAAATLTAGALLATAR